MRGFEMLLSANPSSRENTCTERSAKLCIVIRAITNKKFQKPFREKLLSKLHTDECARRYSELCHFAAYGSEGKGYSLKLNFLPYARIVEILKNSDLVPDDMSIFLEKVLDGMLGVECETIIKYIQILQEISNKNGCTAASGILVNLSNDGKPSFLHLNDLLFLGKSISSEKEPVLKMEKECGMDL